MYHLSMAACEWFLMFLMLIDAALAYLLTKFAHYCELQSPCMFCLRFDHVFGNEKAGSYLSLFCREHRAEVSCLMSCDLHDKLADAREMCDDCFMSITSCQSGTKGYRGRSYLNKNFVRLPSSSGRCSCCEMQWKPKPNARRLQEGRVRLGPAKVTMKPPLPRVAGRGRFRRRSHFKRLRDKISGNSTPCRVVNTIGVMDLETMSDSGCVRFNSDSECEIPVSKDVMNMAEVKFYSDSESESESEIPVSKNVSKAAVLHKRRGSKDDSRDMSGQKRKQTRVIHGTSGQKQDQTCAIRSHGVTDHETSILDGHHNECKPIPASLTSKDPIGHGPKEHNHVELHSRDVSAPLVPQERSMGSIQDSIGHVELHSRNVSAPSMPEERPSTSRGSIQDSIGHVKLNSRDVSAPSVPQERPSTSRGSIQDSIGQVEPNSRDVSAPSLPQERSSTSRGSIQDSIGHVELHSRDVSGPSVPQDPNSTPDRRKLSTDDVLNGNGRPEISKNERSSPSRGSIQDLHSSTDIKSDLPKSDGVNDHNASSSSDKSDGYESPASSVSDVEGESALEKLKRQVEHDRQRLHLLHMELEEERNAAAVAADEAMAMITRLQEEKAALHMEALQYLRMMDEQAEYDMEALDKANDLVAEKDKEIQDLEAELEYFRSRYDEELMMGNDMVETENFQKYHLGNGKTDVKISNFDSKSRKAPVLDLQEEKRYILQCLSELERKFHQVSSDPSIGKSNGNIHTEIENLEDLQADNGTQSKHKDSSTSNGSKKVDVACL
ncbi:hypothetical protein L6452_43148 [Arctium lappa]|uniref:Uncharacterized protein n=1 Tax=Arctium lappa TaxID=4217 RepID=A0ACB8XL06_ARCLA|nr:hypothetical protein L6452_43148 [Arctium lappa]